MKNILKKKRNTGFLSICLIALLVFAVSCEIPENAGSVLEIRAETNIFSHKTFIYVKDLANQNNLNGKILKAKITVLNDNRPNIIVSEGGKYGSIIELNDGVGAFAVNPSYRDFSEPINISLEIYGNDYLTKTTTLTINPDDFITEINETVLKVSDVPEGVAIKQQNVALSGGSNTNAVDISTNTSSDDTSAEVTIPSKNTFKDINGNPINSGNLGVQLVYFDANNDDASRASINGNVNTLIDEDGKTLTNVILSPLATIDVKMSVGSTEVKEFSNPININLDINKNLINPNTGVKVAVGDKISIYSTSDNINWKYLGEQSIIKKGSKLQVSFNTDHLSTFSAAFKVEKCTNGKATLQLPDNGEGFASVYFGVFTTKSGKKIPTVGAKFGASLSLINAPSEQASLKLQPFFSTGSIVIIPETSLCGPIINNSVTSGLKLSGETINLNISAKCPSGNSAIIPNKVSLFIDYESNNNYVFVGLINNGKISIPGITLNKKYNLKVTYNNESGTGNYTFDKKNMEIFDYDIPGETCEKLKL